MSTRVLTQSICLLAVQLLFSCHQLWAISCIETVAQEESSQKSYVLASLGSSYRLEWLEFNYLKNTKLAEHEIFFDGVHWRFVTTNTVLIGQYAFVMSPSGKIYIGIKGKDISSHAAFLRGKPIASGGNILFSDGQIMFIDFFTGHYYQGFQKIGGNRTNRKQLLNELNSRGDVISSFVTLDSFIYRQGFDPYKYHLPIL